MKVRSSPIPPHNLQSPNDQANPGNMLFITVRTLLSKLRLLDTTVTGLTSPIKVRLSQFGPSKGCLGAPSRNLTGVIKTNASSFVIKYFACLSEHRYTLTNIDGGGGGRFR